MPTPPNAPGQAAFEGMVARLRTGGLDTRDGQAREEFKRVHELTVNHLNELGRIVQSEQLGVNEAERKLLRNRFEALGKQQGIDMNLERLRSRAEYVHLIAMLYPPQQEKKKVGEQMAKQATSAMQSWRGRVPALGWIHDWLQGQSADGNAWTGLIDLVKKGFYGAVASLPGTPGTQTAFSRVREWGALNLARIEFGQKLHEAVRSQQQSGGQDIQLAGDVSGNLFNDFYGRERSRSENASKTVAELCTLVVNQIPSAVAGAVKAFGSERPRVLTRSALLNPGAVSEEQNKIRAEARRTEIVKFFRDGAPAGFEVASVLLDQQQTRASKGGDGRWTLYVRTGQGGVLGESMGEEVQSLRRVVRGLPSAQNVTLRASGEPLEIQRGGVVFLPQNQGDLQHINTLIPLVAQGNLARAGAFLCGPAVSTRIKEEEGRRLPVVRFATSPQGDRIEWNSTRFSLTDAARTVSSLNVNDAQAGEEFVYWATASGANQAGWSRF